MLLQAFAHEFVSVTIAELGTTPITSNRFHAFSIDSIAGSTTVELIERQEHASISGSLLEHHCWSQNPVDWRVLKFVKTSLQLYLDKKSKASPSNHSSFYSKIKIYKRFVAYQPSLVCNSWSKKMGVVLPQIQPI